VNITQEIQELRSNKGRVMKRQVKGECYYGVALLPELLGTEEEGHTTQHISHEFDSL